MIGWTLANAVRRRDGSLRSAGAAKSSSSSARGSTWQCSATLRSARASSSSDRGSGSTTAGKSPAPSRSAGQSLTWRQSREPREPRRRASLSMQGARTQPRPGRELRAVAGDRQTSLPAPSSSSTALPSSTSSKARAARCVHGPWRTSRPSPSARLAAHSVHARLDRAPREAPSRRRQRPRRPLPCPALGLERRAARRRRRRSRGRGRAVRRPRAGAAPLAPPGRFHPHGHRDRCWREGRPRQRRVLARGPPAALP